MSTGYPKLTGAQMIKRLKKHGFEVARVKGSHHILKHPDGRSTVVPVHRGETIGPGLLNKIAKDCDLTFEDFRN
ncbi:MAG: type II toxin-antitoxin system HicA family toxin [Opitutales bacterium]